MTLVMAFEFISPMFTSVKAYAEGILYTEEKSFAEQAETINHKEADDEAEKEAEEYKAKNPKMWVFQPNTSNKPTPSKEIEYAKLPDISSLSLATRTNNWYLSKEYDKLPYNLFHIRVQEHIRNNPNNPYKSEIKKSELYLEYDQEKIENNPDLHNLKSYKGSADIWVEQSDAIYIWEVKPYSYNTDADKNKKGLNQLGRYVNYPKIRAGEYTRTSLEQKKFKYGVDYQDSIPDGKFCFWVDVKTPRAVEHVRYDVSYEVCKPGMIYYSFVRVLEGKDDDDDNDDDEEKEKNENESDSNQSLIPPIPPIPPSDDDDDDDDDDDHGSGKEPLQFPVPNPEEENQESRPVAYVPGYPVPGGNAVKNPAADSGSNSNSNSGSSQPKADFSQDKKDSDKVAIYLSAALVAGGTTGALICWSPSVRAEIAGACNALLTKATDFGTFKQVVCAALLIPWSTLVAQAEAYADEVGYNEMTDEEKEQYKKQYIDAGNAPAPRDPLVLDLGESGIELTSIENGVHFDLDNNGFAELTAWIGTEDGFLAIDRNGNGVIDNGGELFGDQVVLKDGTISTSGFEALADFNENGDDVIDKNDRDFLNLRVWVDKNHNGISESNELKSLSELDIVSINLNYTVADYIDSETGTIIAETALVSLGSSESGKHTTTTISEFWFVVDTSDTTQGDGEDIVFTNGNIPDVMVAIAEDDTGVLADLYNKFSTADNVSDKRYYSKKILYFVTGANDIPINSRGGNIDARDLKVIEQFMGADFVGIDGSSTPNANAANILKSLYIRIENLYFNLLNKRTDSVDYMDNLIAYKYEENQVDVYWGVFDLYINKMIEDGKDVDLALYDAATYLKTFDFAYETSTFEPFSKYYSFQNQHFSNIMTLANSGTTYIGLDSYDAYNGTANNDFIFGEKGNDTLHGGNGMDSIIGGEDNDILYGENSEDYLNGGIGDDTLYGGVGNDTLYGDDGNDLLDGGIGDDILKGGAGNDTYVVAKGYGNDTIFDTEGLNTLRFKGLNPNDISVNGTGEYDATLTIKGTNDTLILKDFCKGEEYANYNLEFDNVKMHVTDNGSPFKHIFGGNDDDVLKAVVDDSIMHAFGGNDTVYGSDGNDTIYGNEGDDAIYSGSGNDYAYGGNGNDILDGGEDDDFLYGGKGNDTYIFGRNYGTDIISDSDGVSTIKIAEGISLDELDIISVGENVVISLKDTEDKLIINGFVANPDNYVLEVGGESISIGDNLTVNEEGLLSGSENGDYIENMNSLIVAGGSGDDRIIGTDNGEIVFGDSGNDQLLTGESDDVIFGGSGDDYINGGKENDIIDGDFGNDFIDGGTGDDTYFFNPGCGNDSIKDSDGVNTIMFGDGFMASGIKAYRSNWNDLLITFDGFNDTLIIKNYCINKNARNFMLVFADGTVVETADKNSPLRKIYGTDGSEYMESIYDDGISNDAQSSNDQIIGSNGNDMLYGGDGDERITGKLGDDVLDGGEGDDYLNGATGNDTYIFNKGYGVDTISDGEGLNTINIYGYSASQIKAYRTNWNDISIVFADSDDKIIIEGFFTSEANRNFYLTFNGGGKIHATASNSPLKTIFGTDGNDYMAAMDDKGVTLYGEIGTDNLNGGNGADRLYGGIGDDQLYGNGGNDTLDGGEGNDMLYGGVGSDTYIFNIGNGTDTIIDSEGINTISFGAGLTEDTMTAYRHNWNNLMITFEGIEDKLIIQGYFGSESNRNFEVRFADGTCYAYDDAENPIKQVHASEYDDWMTAWSDNGISLHGDGGNDNLTGGIGNDMLFGGIGNDTLNGNDGSDILDGGESNDFLYGGLGNDTYRFGIGCGSDIIEDSDGDNKVAFHEINFDSVSFEMTDSQELVITVTESVDILTIRNFDSERFSFEFANEVSGTFDVETREFKRTLSEEELAQVNAYNLN